MSDISLETHEFRAEDNSTLYSSIRDALQISHAIDDERFGEQVAGKIQTSERKGRNDSLNGHSKSKTTIKKYYDQIKNGTIIDDKNVLEALASVIRVILCVILVKINDQITSSVHVRYYGENLPCSECVYIIYDEIRKHYNSLYIFNKKDEKREKSIFHRKDGMIHTLLHEFIKKTLKYCEFVPLDDQADTVIYQEVLQIQHDSDNKPMTVTTDSCIDTLEKKQQAARDDQCSPCISTKTLITNTANQLLSNMTTKISPETHNFCRRKVPGDGSCLYSSARKVLGISKTINNEELRKEVADKIKEHPDLYVTIPDYGTDPRVVEVYYDRIVNHNAFGGERELRALSILKKIVIGVVCVIKTGEDISLVYMRYYGEKDRSSTKCVYVIYDRAATHYDPLYVCKRKNPRILITTFNYPDPNVDALLDDFIKKELKYNGLVRFNEEQMSGEDNISNETVDTPDSITSDVDMDILNEEKRSDIAKLPTTKTVISTTTHQFRVGQVPGDDRCLFSTTLYGFDRSDMISIKSLRKNVADYIRQSNDINDVTLLFDSNGGTREDNCLKIEEGIRWGGELERKALAVLYPNNLFCVISKIYEDENKFSVHVDQYVNDILSYKRCVCMLYDGATKIYIPLYLYDIINHEEEKSNFRYDNNEVRKLLGEFIQNDLHYYGNVKFDDDCSIDEIETHSAVEQETDVYNLITMDQTTSPKKTQKRKRTGDDESLSIREPITKIPSISSTNDVNPPSTYNRSIPPSDALSNHDNPKDVSIDITRLVSTNRPRLRDFTSVSSVEERMETTPIVCSPDTTVANIEEGMRLKTEIIKTFRGRTKGNFIPKNKKKRDGTESKPRKAIYFSDNRNSHCLILLIPEKYLFGDLHRICVEICIVTPDIKGCTYIHPYFKFPLRPKDYPSPDINPLYLYLGYDDEHGLKKYVDKIKSLLLYLCVIMLTNDQLIQNQPIKPFPSSTSNGQVLTRIYKNSDEFKSDFSLNEMRFAFTLWIKESLEQGYHRHDEIQYISQVSTQDQDAKVQDNMH